MSLALPGQPFNFEHRIRSRNGKEARVVAASAQLELGDDGQTIRYHGAIHDVTEQRHVEAQFRQAQRMEAVGRLAGGVAHDFNNLLGVLMGQAEFLIEETEADSTQRRRAEEILDTVLRATRITRQMLDISRQQSGERTVVDLNQLVRTADSMLRRLLGEHIEIRSELKASRHCILANGDQLTQILMNLAVNARDAMPRGGHLRIETCDVAAGSPEAAKVGKACLRLAVTDDGVGMDDKTRTQIFDPFFTTKERGKGTGLGLSMVYGIVRSLGGCIEVQSSPGHGASFRLYLPTVSEAASEASVAPPGKLERGTGTILLAEDEEGLRHLLRESLQSGGYRVLESADVNDAIRVASRECHGIDLLVTDVVMPVMSGKDLAHAIHALHPQLKVLFISGYTDNVLADYEFVPEQLRFLQKPFSKDVFLRKVAEVLHHS